MYKGKTVRNFKTRCKKRTISRHGINDKVCKTSWTHSKNTEKKNDGIMEIFNITLKIRDMDKITHIGI